MSKILELREKRAKAWEAAKAFLDSKRGDDDLLSAEDGAIYDKMEAEVVNIGREIERLERRREIDTDMNSIVNGQPLVGSPLPQAAKIGRASDEYKRAFWNAIRSKNGGFDITNSLKIGMDAEGGYLVPDEYEQRIILLSAPSTNGWNFRNSSTCCPPAETKNMTPCCRAAAFRRWSTATKRGGSC